MALADLRRLAATRVAPAMQSTGHMVNQDESRRTRPFFQRVAPVTLVTAAFCNDGCGDYGPGAPCPVCAGSLWVRRSVLSGGPGCWRCDRCDPLPADVWVDATVVPAVAPSGLAADENDVPTPT